MAPTTTASASSASTWLSPVSSAVTAEDATRIGLGSRSSPPRRLVTSGPAPAPWLRPPPLRRAATTTPCSALRACSAAEPTRAAAATSTVPSMAPTPTSMPTPSVCPTILWRELKLPMFRPGSRPSSTSWPTTRILAPCLTSLLVSPAPRSLPPISTTATPTPSARRLDSRTSPMTAWRASGAATSTSIRRASTTSAPLLMMAPMSGSMATTLLTMVGFTAGRRGAERSTSRAGTMSSMPISSRWLARSP
mmetsp:Transcript_458/g.805  ORF Transcript_458/g.805 Transcript_458/m.805 type:complete len:250 (-) Transcript_458:356-1105(-)